MTRLLMTLVLSLLVPAFAALADGDRFANLRDEWPDTDFSQASVDIRAVIAAGPPKDGISSIDDPRFIPAQQVTELAETEPLISVLLGGDAHAYPFRILIRHEIVNDWVGGLPVAITYCPLCNSAIAFDRHVAGEAVEFGTTGRLYLSNLVMYDRRTESWWAQFTGEAIAGELNGMKLKRLPSRIESFASFRKRHPDGNVLVPPRRFPGRPYGGNPYADYDSLPAPWFRAGILPRNIPAMARVVTVGDRAWALTLLRKKGLIETSDGLIITWQAGQNSALDHRTISKGRDVGNVLVRRQTPDGPIDIPYGVDFAFAFHAFHPKSKIITR